MEKIDIASLNLQELKEAISALGQPNFRATQIYKWLHSSLVTSFDEMSNLSLELRKKLDDNFVIFGCSIEKKLVSCYDNTIKYLYKLNDGEFVEAVVMEYKYGYTICISTQVGCRMGCKFCASTLDGCKRSLRPSELLAQVYTAQRDIGKRISHIVLMGMGEPLDNYDNVLKFLRLVSDENGINIGMRNISLSTCGLVPQMYKLAQENLQLTLSVSLHAPNDDIRRRLMPVSKKWSIEELLTACRDYINTTNRRISFEYSLVSGVNDSDECADELAARLKGMLCHVNLIPVNEVKETDCHRSSEPRVRSFSERLQRQGINATVRRTLGSDINASCGQLRRASRSERKGSN